MTKINSSDLHNNGIFNLYWDNPTLESTFLIVGQARAGTTMLSRLLHEMGVPMGKEIGPVYEDNKLGAFVKELQCGTVSNEFICEIVKRNEKSKKWGWKRPDLYLYLEHILCKFRNPKIICILRDPVSISGRNEISLSENIEDTTEKHFVYLNRAINEQMNIIKKIQAFKISSLLISYEKALLNPTNLITSLSNFAGLDLQRKEVSRFLELIQPNHKGYSFRARSKSFDKTATRFGHLHGVQNNYLRASLKSLSYEEKIEFWIDGICKTQKVYEISNKDHEIQIELEISKLVTQQIHSIELRFASDGQQFFNSPFVWRAVSK